MAGPVFIAAMAGALLGAVLSLGILAWLNDGELEFVPARSPLGDIAGVQSSDFREQIEDLDAQVGRLKADVADLEAAAERQAAEPTSAAGTPTPMDADEPIATSTALGVTPEDEAADPTATRRPTATQRPEPTERAPSEPTEPSEPPTATREPTADRRPAPRPTATLKIVP